MKALDVVLGSSLAVPYKGKSYQFAPLSLGDMADIVAHNKSEALRMYLHGINQEGIAEIPPGVRFTDIHNILQRSSVPDDFSPSDPGNLLQMVYRSLRRAGNDLTIDEVDKILSDDAFRESAVTVVEVMLQGPIDPVVLNDDGSGGERSDPT